MYYRDTLVRKLFNKVFTTLDYVSLVAPTGDDAQVYSQVTSSFFTGPILILEIYAGIHTYIFIGAMYS